MKEKIKATFVIFASLLMGAGVSYLFLRAPATTSGRRVKPVSVVRTSHKDNVRKVTEISLVEENGKKAVHIVESEIKRAGVASVTREDDIDEEDLTPLQKQILAELQAALDDNNLGKVRKALSKLVARVEKGGLGGKVPVCMRMKAVEALGWFGKDAAIDLMAFMADPSEEVAAEASSQFELALQDCEMGDLERSTILKSAMQAISDPELVDSLLTQLNDMRNSRKVATISDILANGTEQAKKMMLEQLPDYTDSEVTTESDLKKWLAENPDDEDDAELYGGAKSE